MAPGGCVQACKHTSTKRITRTKVHILTGRAGVQPFPDANILILGDPIFRSMLVLHDLEPPLYRVGLAAISDTYGIGDAPINPWGDEGGGTQFTCFTSTKGQKLTQKRGSRGRGLKEARAVRRSGGRGVTLWGGRGRGE
jgi:hypothetical protein